MQFESKYNILDSWICIWKCRLRYGGHFVQGRELESSYCLWAFDAYIRHADSTFIAWYDDLFWLPSRCLNREQFIIDNVWTKFSAEVIGNRSQMHNKVNVVTIFVRRQQSRGVNKMRTILKTTFFKCIVLKDSVCISPQFTYSRGSNWQIVSFDSSDDLVPYRLQVIMWTNEFADAYICHRWPLLLTWINLNTAWISNPIPTQVGDEITYPLPNLNGYTVEVWEWITNFMPHIMMDEIIYACWDQS